MPAELVWSPRAQTDIRGIYVTIGLEQPQAAERFYERFQHKASLLINQPRLGMRHPEISPAARMLVEAPSSSSVKPYPIPMRGPYTR